MALSRAGFEVRAICPSGHPISQTSVISRIYGYHALRTLSSLKLAIDQAEPDLMIPCDDLATSHLHRLYHVENPPSGPTGGIRELIAGSLGEPSNYPLLDSRHQILDLAREQGITVPITCAVKTDRDLATWISEHGLPAVLKTDGSSGGVGVRIVRTTSEAQNAFRELKAPPLAARTVKRAIVDRDYSLIQPFLNRVPSSVSVQRFISGRDASSAVACWQGEAIASIEMEVIKTWKPRGPAAVIRIIDQPEMRDAIAKMVRQLGLTGLFGFDFMIEDQSAKPYLIEINPRATQTAHLCLGPGKDLAAALYSRFTKEPLRASPSLTDKDVIALFPQEWQNDPASDYIKFAYHDVPWEEPDFVKACIQSREREARWFSYENWISLRSKFGLPRA
jgi:hypothetical protein